MLIAVSFAPRSGSSAIELKEKMGNQSQGTGLETDVDYMD